MKLTQAQMRELGFKDAAPAVAAAVDQPSVFRSIGVGLLVWAITRWLDGRFS